MTEFEFWQMAYNEQWATIDEVHEAVEVGFITAADYETITGEPYVPAA